MQPGAACPLARAARAHGPVPWAWGLVWAALVLLAGCGDGGGGGKPGYAWNLPPGVPRPVVPADNPMTAEKVELGRHLFYDTRLSGDGSLACAGCHMQALAFTDGIARPTGITGEVHPRNSMALANTGYFATLTWANNVLVTLERQIVVPLFGEFPVEQGITDGNKEQVLDRFRGDGDYQELFADAFPQDSDPFTYHRIVQAIASFLRSLTSFDSPRDRQVYYGEQDALSDSARRGSGLFFSERFECDHCHGGFGFNSSMVHENTTFIERPFHNNGLYNLDGEGAYPGGNQGLIELTGDPDDMGKFRPPSLRNVALTAPYMHDGSIATLGEVIDMYAAGGRVIESGPYAGDGRANPHKSGLVAGFTMTAQERTDILNFLKSLTDETFVTNPAIADPFAD